MANYGTTSITVALCALHVLILGRVIYSAITEREIALQAERRERRELRKPPTVIDVTDLALAAVGASGQGGS